MAQLGIKAAVISLIVLLVLVFVAQLVVGVFGTASAQVNNTLVTTAGANSLAVKQFGQVGTANTTVINFIPIVILVALIVIILALFGLRNLLNVGGEDTGI